MSNLLFTKVRNAKAPERAHIEDAGIDFFVPEFDYNFLKDFENKNRLTTKSGIINSTEILVAPHDRVLIPSGIRVILHPGSALVALNKSGVATKKGLLVTAQLIDPQYTGEVHIGVYNSGDDSQIINCGEKLVQFIHIPIFSSIPEELGFEIYEQYISKMGSDRGDNGFGSTNK